MTTTPRFTTSPDRWHKASEIFADSLEHAAGAPRDAFLSKMCAGDDVLMQLVQALIDREKKTAPLLRATHMAGALAAALAGDAAYPSDTVEGAARWIGRRLGSYKIVSEIARGGMGWVFKGVRDDAEFNKDVAIKLVRDSGDQARLVERFKAERQILATLDHPNIARLIDGGSTEEGFPFLVMEFVDGEPITEYARRDALGINAKLELFRAVCAAVHFAHQRLVVHRDLKPSNIFVTAAGEVKLLDFGIAKMLQSTSPSSGADGGAAAATTLLAMTPAYASPEQIKGETITTASDVYALGVVLYELLTGQSPYKSKTTQPVALAREICETDPERPSTVVGRTITPIATAAIDGTGVSDAALVNTLQSASPALNALLIKRLQRGLRGDLDNIVLMALRKDPTRRYASAEQLAEDVKRYAQDLPVSARADTFSYRATKFVQRNRWAVGFAGSSFIGLVGAVVVVLHQANLTQQALQRAEQNFVIARKLANDYTNEIYNGLLEIPNTLPLQKVVLARAADQLSELSKTASDNPALLTEIGLGYTMLAIHQGTDGQTNWADAQRNLKLGRDSLNRALLISPNYLPAVRTLIKNRYTDGEILSVLKRFDESDTMFNSAISLGRQHDMPGVDAEQVRLELTMALMQPVKALRCKSGECLANLREAATRFETLMREVKAERRRRVVQNQLASVYMMTAEHLQLQDGVSGQTSAVPWIDKSVATFKDLLAQAPDDVVVMNNLVGARLMLVKALQRQGLFSDAQAQWIAAHEMAGKLLKIDAKDETNASLMFFVEAYGARLAMEAGDVRLARDRSQAAVAQRAVLPVGAEKLPYVQEATIIALRVQAELAMIESDSPRLGRSEQRTERSVACDLFRQTLKLAAENPSVMLMTEPALNEKIVSESKRCDHTL